MAEAYICERFAHGTGGHLMATEKRLIDANELLQSEINRCGRIPTIGTGYLNETSFKSILDQAPTVDAVEVVHGRWEPYPKAKGFEYCSVCHDCFIYDDWGKEHKWYYCPNCGAKMDGGNNGQE